MGTRARRAVQAIALGACAALLLGGPIHASAGEINLDRQIVPPELPREATGVPSDRLGQRPEPRASVPQVKPAPEPLPEQQTQPEPTPAEELPADEPDGPYPQCAGDACVTGPGPDDVCSNYPGADNPCPPPLGPPDESEWEAWEECHHASSTSLAPECDHLIPGQ
jgi:hypothetical protein